MKITDIAIKSISRIFRLTGGEQRFTPYFWTEGSVGGYSYGGYSLLEFIENGYMNPYVFMCIDKIADVSSQLSFNVIEEKAAKQQAVQDAWVEMPDYNNFATWVFDEAIFNWHAPVPFPQDNKGYYWDESIINWVEING